MPHYCYIIFSKSLDRYYIGETEDFSTRLHMHNIGFSSFTSKATDWRLHVLITCPHKLAALRVEKHVKSMKSRKYMENLARYPEMIAKLLSRFDD